VLEQPAPVESPESAAPVASAPPPEAFSSPVAVVERPAPPPPAAEPVPTPQADGAAPPPGVPVASAGAPPAPGDLPPFSKPSRVASKPAPAPAAAAPAQPIRRKPPAQAQSQTQMLARANIPAVFVSSTVWHPERDRRLAKVTFEGSAMRELHEGDSIGPLVVSKIEPSGVIFLHDGVELRRRVGAKN
jgi:hypothetical protein